MEADKPKDHSSQTSDNIDNVSDISDDNSYDAENNVESAPQEDLVLAKNENRWVWRLRFLVALVLLTATIAVCLAVYFDGRQDEQEAFEHDFAGLADKLVVSFESVVQQRFGAIDLFTSDMTANANGSWPFVEPPGFTRRMAEVHRMAGLSITFLLMKVEEEDRAAWEEYSVSHLEWKREGMAFLMGKNPDDIVSASIFPKIMDKDSVPGELIVDQGKRIGIICASHTALLRYLIHNLLFLFVSNRLGPGPYFPAWMSHPVGNQTNSNFNMGRDPEHRGVLDYVVANKRPAFEHSFDYLNPNVPKDMRYELFKRTENWDYQGDALAVAQFPSKYCHSLKMAINITLTFSLCDSL